MDETPVQNSRCSSAACGSNGCPVITILRDHLQSIGEEEIERCLNRIDGVTETKEKFVHELVERLINRLLSFPRQTCRSLSEEQRRKQFRVALQRLFDVNDEESGR